VFRVEHATRNTQYFSKEPLARAWNFEDIPATSLNGGARHAAILIVRIGSPVRVETDDMSTLLLLALALSGSVSAADRASAEKTRILLIGHKHDHPPGTHMYLEVCELLAKCLRQTPDVEAVVSDGWPSDPGILKGVRAIVFYTSPGGDILLNPAHRKQAERLLREGVGLAAIHWATGANTDLGPRYQQLLGGWFHTDFSSLETTTAKLQQADSSHPVCRGWQEYDLKEEFYLNLKFQPEARPILKVLVKGQEQVVGWAHERPDSRKGRSFGTTLGHFYDNFRSEAFRRLLVNGILWTAHREVPREGAPCRIEEADIPKE